MWIVDNINIYTVSTNNGQVGFEVLSTPTKCRHLQVVDTGSIYAVSWSSDSKQVIFNMSCSLLL